MNTIILDDIIDIISGGTPKTSNPEFWGGNIPWLSVKDFNNDNRYVYKTEKSITELGLNHSAATLLQKDDIVLSARGTVGAITMVPFPMTFNQSCYGLRAKEGFDQTYLYYCVKNAVEKLKHITHGSVFDTITRDTFRSIEVVIHSYKEQKAIADILSNLDNKIELNNHINQNLLQQARTVFKAWFIDFEIFDERMVESPVGGFIPESLKMIQIQDLPHILETGKRPKGGASSEGIPSVGAENVKDIGVFSEASAKYIPFEFAASMKKGKIEGYELLLYKDGGKPGTFTPHFSMFGEGFPYKEFYINEHVFKLDFFNHGYNEFAYLYMQTDYPYHWLANNGGKAAIPGINQQDVNSIWIYDFNHPKIQEFCKWVQPLFTELFLNCAQNIKLAQLRDSLLPKLMSGEVDVSDIAL